MIKVLVLSLLLSGCTALTAVDAVTGLFKDDKGLEVNTELVVGDKNQELQVGHEQTATTINNIQEVPLAFIALLAIVWLFPTPKTMWKGLVQFRGNRVAV